MKSLRRLIGLCLAIAVAGGLLAAPVYAQSPCETEVGRFISIEGSVEVKPDGGATWVAADPARMLCEGDTIRVDQRSRAAIALINDAVMRLDQNTTMRLLDIGAQETERSILDIVKGAFQTFIRKPRTLSVNTPYLNGSIEGTEFLVRVDDIGSEMTVFEGTVVAANEYGQLTLNPGEAARAERGQTPQRRLVARPRDQVRWALYYPPVLSVQAIADERSNLQQVADCLSDNDSACAFAVLDGVPADARDAGFYAAQAAVLLSVGRVDEAGADLDTLLRLDPDSGVGYALRAVIAVTRNDNQQALADARRGVELRPALAAAKIALSYAQQAMQEIGAARDTLLAALNDDPDDALAWARLAELQLMLGERTAATAAAQRAVELRPGLSRTQNVLGFAALAEVRIDVARSAFDRAIVLDSADPLPRLGLGLAKIRRGQLAAGRAELDAAVGLDPNNPLLRAYLGKAYFEERRGPLDAQQFAIAKDLDPLDPTAFFYDAIRLQSENRPVEALTELEGSIARNDQRAVYRSRLLLDQDRAARGASLARIYKDLGFNRLGHLAATRSMTLDPGNASAHRFLSDAYRDNSERTEVARVSELLQSQLLQDLSINPVQPSESSTNLNIVTSGGPSNAGFNEFSPLFERDRLRVDATALVAGNDTVGAEAVASAIYGPVSASVGGFGYETDGYRPNNDLEHAIWDVYGQWAITPTTNVQAEYLNRHTEHGDLRQRFDLDDSDDDLRRDLDSEVWRLGARVSPTADSDVLVSYIHSDVDSTGLTVPLNIPGTIRVDEEQSQSDEADQLEAQFIHRADDFTLVLGAAHAKTKIDGSLTSTTMVTLPPPGPGLPPVIITDPPLVFPIESDTQDTRGYVYGNLHLHEAVLATLGISYQSYDEDLISDGVSNDFSRWSPKLGIRWRLSETLTARGAYFETVKPVLVSNRTLEPTQVAGFNQFFDDPDATRATRYGVGVDWRPRSDVHIGGEVTKRDVESPVIDFTTSTVVYEDRDEWLSRAYVYWTPRSRWALRGELQFDEFSNQGGSLVADVVPDRVTTWTLPLEASYFDPTGWFASTRVTLVDQEVRRDGARSTLAVGDSSFALWDAAVGYRFPKRSGLVSLSIQNLFDRDFDYQDNSYRTFSDEPYIGPYVPEQSIVVRISLSF